MLMQWKYSIFYLFHGRKISVANSAAAKVKLAKVTIVRVFCASLFLNFGACSGIVDNLGLEGLSPSRLSTTGIGTVAGGALGAGVGAIIGSTTGDAGEGLLIGTGVGAIAGAAVGYELESQGEELAVHQATISRQQQEIQQQKLELEQIKGRSIDGNYTGQGYQVDPRYQDVSSNQIYNSDGTFSIPAQNRSSRDVYGNGQNLTTGYQENVVTSSAARTIQENDLIARNVRSSLTPNSGITVRTVQPVLPAAKVIQAQPVVIEQEAVTRRVVTQKPVVNFAKNQRSSNEPIRVAKTYGMDVDKTISTRVEKTEIITPVANEGIITKKVETVVSTPVKQAVTFPVNTAASTKSQVASVSSSSGSCGDAESEVTRARGAASDTDKLFYYRRALRLCKSKPEYHVEIGRVYSSIGRREEAEFEFSRALEIDPEYRDAQDELTMLMLNNTY